MKLLDSYFSEVKDFRVAGRCLHILSDILGLVLCGVLSDCDNFVDIVDYGEDNIDFLRADLGFCFPSGIPSEDTLERIFKRLDIRELEGCYQKLASDISLSCQHIILDGKELRSCIPEGKKHSIVQMVNVWVSNYHLSFGQSKVEEKSNEITAIPEVLKTIDYRNSVVSIDAIGCQKEIVSQIVGQQADYVIALKKNQKVLYEQVEAEFLRQQADLAVFVSRDLGHGRAEERKVYLLENLSFIDAKQDWVGLKSIAMVNRKVWREGKKQNSKHFYISSLFGVSPEKMGQYIRSHWAIENGLHWQLDVTFKEDDSPIRAENAIINLHIIRKWALHLLKKDPSKMSLQRKRKKAHRNNLYLKQLLK